MKPEAFHKFRQLDVSCSAMNADEFADAYPATRRVTDRLWELLDDSNTVLLEVPERTVQQGRGRRSGERPLIVVAEIDSLRSQNDDTSFRVSGAAVGQVLNLLVRRDRMRKRLAEVTAGYRDENPVALTDAANNLDRRARTRDDLSSSFEETLVSADAIRAAYYHDEFERSSVRPLSKLGV